MLRLFRLRNKGRMGWWVIAENETQAIDLSMEHPAHSKNRENIRIIADQTEFYAPTTDLAEVKVVGLACFTVGPKGRRWAVSRGGKRIR